MAGSDQAGLLHRLDRGGPVGVRLNPKRNILAAWTIEERPIRHDLAAQHRGIELGIGPLSQYHGNGFVNLRTEDGHVGQECISTFHFRVAPYTKNKKQKKTKN